MSTTNTIVRKSAPDKPKEARTTRPPPIVVSDCGDKRMTEAAIRFRAYHKWEAAGKPPGDGVNFWLEAERELLHVK